MNESTSAKQKINLSLRKKLCFSALFTLIFFCTLEGLLRFLDVEPSADFEDPFVGFSGLVPLMESSTNDEGEPMLSTAKNKLHWFNAQTFSKKKNAGTKRIFCMGGSTTYGHPYWDSTSFPGWLREFLPIVDNAHEWEVINAGGISYASYRVAALMQELAQYEPDLFVVYSAHNEFLERRTYEGLFDTSTLSIQSRALLSRTRVWALADRIINPSRSVGSSPRASGSTNSSADTLPSEVDEILNHTVGPVAYHRDDNWRANVVKHYEANLRRMVSIAKHAGAKIVFVTPASNEKNCSPFKSEHSSRFSEPDLESLNVNLNQATVDSSSVERSAQIEASKEVIKIDPRHAESRYRLGHLYLAAHRYEDAQHEFTLALNEDVCPLRAVSEISAAIERVSQSLKVPMVDFEQKLRQRCEAEHGHSVLGDEYFLDHVHPTIDVNRRLARWIIEELQVQQFVLGTRVTDTVADDLFSAAEKRVLAQIDHEAQAYARLNLAKVMHWSGKFEEAIPHANAALKVLPKNLESRYVLARCLTNLNRHDEALREYETLFSSGRDYPKAYLHFGELLAKLEEWDRAKAYLLMAVLYDEKNAHAYDSLGLLHLQLQEFRFAVEAFEKSNQFFPNNTQTLSNLAKAKEELRRESMLRE